MQTIDVVIKTSTRERRGEGGPLSCLGNSFSLHPSSKRILYEKLILKKVSGAHAPENEPQQDQRFGSEQHSRLKSRGQIKIQDSLLPAGCCNWRKRSFLKRNAVSSLQHLGKIHEPQLKPGAGLPLRQTRSKSSTAAGTAGKWGSLQKMKEKNPKMKELGLSPCPPHR